MNTNLSIPNGDGVGNPIELSMGSIRRAIERLEEVAIINDHKAPELISCFIKAYADLTDHISRVSSEVVKAKNAVAKRTAIVTLDESPRILREKGLISGRSPAGSEDQRRAVLEVDEEFLKTRDRLQELEAYAELLEGKRDSIERAYLAVRKIIGESFQFRNQRLGSSLPNVDVSDFKKTSTYTESTPVDDVMAQFSSPRD